jgi:CRP-like cAMP-binding protein
MDAAIDSNLKKSYIKKQQCFTKLYDNEIEELAGLLIEKHVRAGTVIVTEGDLVDKVFLIVSGDADVRIAEIKDRKLSYKSVATLKPGASIGLNETGFYSLSGKRTATVISNTDMVLLELSVAKFHGFALAYPHVNEVMRISAEAYK